MAEVGSAWVSVAPDAKGFGNDLERQVGSEVGKSGKGMGSKLGGAIKLGLIGAVAGGGIALVGMLKGSLDEAREAQKVGALTTSTIKATGSAANVTAKQVGDLAGALSNKTGIDDEVIQSGQNMLLTFKNVRNEAGKGNDVFNQASTTLVDMAAAMGKDPKSAAIGLGKALNDPVKGVSALSKVGVTFNDQQKATIENLVATGDSMSAQKVILKELNSEFGGAAEAQATAGDKARVAWGNFQETIGTALLPVVDKLLGIFTRLVLYLTANVGPAFKRVQAFVQPLVDAIGGVFGVLSQKAGGGGGFMASLSSVAKTVATNLLPVLTAMATFFMGTLLPAVTSVAQYLLANLIPIFTTIWTIVSTQLLPIISSLAQFFYTTLLPAIMAIYSSVAKSLKPVFDALFKAIKETLLPAVQQLLAKFKEWQPTLQKVAVIVLKVVGFLLKLVAAILGKVLPIVIRLAAFIIKVLVKAIIIAVDAIVGIIKVLIAVGRAFGKAGSAVGDFAGKVKDGIVRAVQWVADLDNKIKDAVAGFATLLIHAGEELINGLIEGITNKIGALTDKMSALGDKVKGFLPGSPVKTGPLTAWNKGSGPGGALVDRIAAGLSDTRPVTAAMARLTGAVQLTDAGGLALATAGAGGVGGLAGTRLRLVVDGREFNAYVDGRADDRVSSAQDFQAERGRAAWSR